MKVQSFYFNARLITPERGLLYRLRSNWCRPLYDARETRSTEKCREGGVMGNYAALQLWGVLWFIWTGSAFGSAFCNIGI